jgi:hypothetical protein
MSGGKCEQCCLLISETNVPEIKNWRRQWRFCSYKCYYERCAWDVKTGGTCEKCDCKITNLKTALMEHPLTYKYRFCSRVCRVLSTCKVNTNKYDESGDMPCNKCDICKKCINCEKCECPKEEDCCNMNCTNKATKFQKLDDPSCSITGDGRDWYCQECYSDCVGDEEEIEPNDRCIIEVCRNKFTEKEKGQLINTTFKGRMSGLGYICTDCFKKRGEKPVDYSEMEQLNY